MNWLIKQQQNELKLYKPKEPAEPLMKKKEYEDAQK